MKILLFITSIHNTLDNGEFIDYKNLIQNLDNIRKLKNYDNVFISFCDNTENKNILLFYSRKLINHMMGKRIFFAWQLLGDVYYSSMDSGAIMYSNQKMKKIDKILDYIKKIEDDGIDCEIIVVDGDMDINEYKKRFNDEISYPFTLINNVSNVKEINEYLSELYDKDEKRLKLKNDPTE